MRVMRHALRCLMVVVWLLQGPSVTQAADNLQVLVSIKPIHSVVAGLMEGAQRLFELLKKYW